MRKALVAIIFLLVAVNAHATTYWATVSGGAGTCGAASGTSDPGAYRTLTQGVACLASGDTLNLKTGTYTTQLNLNNVPSGGGSYASATIIQSAPGNLATLQVNGNGIYADSTNFPSYI